jgi:hypothetical protein
VGFGRSLGVLSFVIVDLFVFLLGVSLCLYVLIQAELFVKLVPLRVGNDVLAFIFAVDLKLL